MNLEQEVERLRAENRELRQQLAVALAHIVELEAQLPGPGEAPAFVKANRQQKVAGAPQPRKKRAAVHNKARRRAQPTRIERHALEHCPECRCRLRGESLDYRREVLELPPPQAVEVLEHQVVKRWCPHCACWRSPHLDLRGQVIGQGRIGVGIASLVAWLRTSLRMPARQVQEYLATLHNLTLSSGEIIALTHAVGQELQGAADQLLVTARGQEVVHQDETGWRQDGQNGYVWLTATDGAAAVRHYEFSLSRSHHVPQRLLGPRFQGVLVSDFYAAYNLLPGRHQRCWVHLLRDLHHLKDAHPESAESIAWALAVRQLYDEAQAWLAAHLTPTTEQRQQYYLQLQQRACALGQQHAFTAGHPCCALAKRLLRHQDELFQFVLVPGLPADNNLAERGLRPLVIMRKISGGSRSPHGTRTRLTLASLFATWQARLLNPFNECLTALQHAAPTPQAASP